MLAIRLIISWSTWTHARASQQGQVVADGKPEKNIAYSM
jgi:hypothetical protein